MGKHFALKGFHNSGLGAPNKKINIPTMDVVRTHKSENTYFVNSSCNSTKIFINKVVICTKPRFDVDFNDQTSVADSPKIFHRDLNPDPVLGLEREFDRANSG